MKEIFLEIISIIVSSLIISFVFWLYTPESTMKAVVFLPIIIILCILLYGAVRYIFYLHNKLKEHKLLLLPRLKAIEGDFYIFEPSDLYMLNSYVILCRTGTSQEQITVGYVETINIKTKNIQVKLIKNIDSKLKYELLKHKNDIILMPTVTTDYVPIDYIKGDYND